MPEHGHCSEIRVNSGDPSEGSDQTLVGVDSQNPSRQVIQFLLPLSLDSMPPDRSLICRVVTILCLMAGLKGCGGETENVHPSAVSKTPTYSLTQSTAPFEFPINPGATWKPLMGDRDGLHGPVTVIDLRKLVASAATLAGTTLTVRALGAYESSSEDGIRSTQTNVSAVFVDAKGVFVRQTRQDALPDAVTRICRDLTGDADPFFGDFLIPAGEPARLVVPAGAVQLRVSVDDCRFIDNVSSTVDPLRLHIRAVDPMAPR